MFKIAVSIKVKKCNEWYNHWCNVSIYYCLVSISTKVYNLTNDFDRKDDRFNNLVCNLLKINIQIFIFLRDQFLVFKRVHIEIFSKNVSFIRYYILLRYLFIYATLKIVSRPFILVTLRIIRCSRSFVGTI